MFSVLPRLLGEVQSYFQLPEESEAENSALNNLNEAQKRILRYATKRLKRDCSNNQILSPSQLTAFNSALEHLRETEPEIFTEESNLLLDRLTRGTTELFNDPKEAVESYLAATNAIREICNPTSTLTYLAHLLLRLAYSIAGFCTMYSSIESIINKIEDPNYRNEHYYDNLVLEIIPGILSGLANAVFTHQLLKLIKEIAAGIPSNNNNYYSNSLPYFIPGFFATIPAVVPMLHTEKSFPLAFRLPVVLTAFNALWPIYTKDFKEFTKILSSGYQDGLTNSTKKICDFVKENKLETAGKATMGLLGGIQAFCYTRVITSYLELQPEDYVANFAITAGFMAARIPFVTIITRNAAKAFKDRDQTNGCSCKNGVIFFLAAANCANSALVVYTKSDMDPLLKDLAIPATLIFHFFNRLKNFIGSQYISADRLQQILNQEVPSNSLRIQTARQNAALNQIT